MLSSFLSKSDTQDKSSSSIETDNQYLNYPLDIASHFQLPITYIENKNVLQSNIIEDLELIQCLDSSSNSVYKKTFAPITEVGEVVMKEIPKYYTTDETYLCDTQKFLKGFQDCQSSENEEMDSQIINIWKEIRGDTGFKARYHYIEWKYWEYLNENP